MLYYIKSPVITMFVASFCGTLLIYFNSIANLLFAYEWVSPVQLIVTAGNIAGAVIFCTAVYYGTVIVGLCYSAFCYTNRICYNKCIRLM